MKELAWVVSAALQDENPEQRLASLLGIQPLLIHAPAGCGKTQALAERAAALVTARVLHPHQRILALTFSNKARDNLTVRVRERLGFHFRRFVSVTNFHGLAARLIRAHGEVIGVARDVAFPERGWRRRTIRELGIEASRLSVMESALRAAKRQPNDDQGVWDAICSSAVPEAEAFEGRLRAENRLDFDDLLRHAQRLLAIAKVRRLYELHFAAVFVDELQDLTLQQFQVVTALAGSSLTAVVDRAQGIYRFAGAETDRVLEECLKLNPAVLEFSRSYRSAPRVLEAVNCLARKLGTPRLACARPQDWDHPGTVAVIRRTTEYEEAEFLTQLAQDAVLSSPSDSIAVVVRSRRRGVEVRGALEAGSVNFEDWDDASHNPAIISGIREAHRGFVAVGGGTIGEFESFLRSTLPPTDPELLDGSIEALEFIREEISEGVDLSTAVARLKRSRRQDQPVGPGLHLLTGHSGKGQQFDHVFVVGLERGHIPDFRAKSPQDLEEELRILHVMASRAKKSLVFTAVARKQNRFGTWFDEVECEWLRLVEAIRPEHW